MIRKSYICAKSHLKFFGKLYPEKAIFSEDNFLSLPRTSLKFDIPNQKLNLLTSDYALNR